MFKFHRFLQISIIVILFDMHFTYAQHKLEDCPDGPKEAARRALDTLPRNISAEDAMLLKAISFKPITKIEDFTLYLTPKIKPDWQAWQGKRQLEKFEALCVAGEKQAMEMRHLRNKAKRLHTKGFFKALAGVSTGLLGIIALSSGEDVSGIDNGVSAGLIIAGSIVTFWGINDIKVGDKIDPDWDISQDYARTIFQKYNDELTSQLQDGGRGK